MIIYSPATVMSVSIKKTLDILNPKIKLFNPKKIIFIVASQIYGKPHLGTYMTQAFTFVFAQKIRETFGIETQVLFYALDNAPYDIIVKNNISYQIDFCHAHSRKDIEEIVKSLYGVYFQHLSDILDIDYNIKYYSDEQLTPMFRRKFIDSIKYHDKLKWYLDPSTASLCYRTVCPFCLYADKWGINTNVIESTSDSLTIGSYCFEHGIYQVKITPDNDVFFDLSTLYRNIVKESVYCDTFRDELFVMVKGSDWSVSTPFVDCGLEIMGYKMYDVPITRIFTPQIVDSNGAKLAKSTKSELLKTSMKDLDWLKKSQELLTNSERTIKIVSLCQYLILEPKNFFRCYSSDEIERLLKLI